MRAERTTNHNYLWIQWKSKKVCSIFGTALEQTFDHGSSSGSVMTSILRNHEIVHETNYPTMANTRTNNFQILNNNYVNNNNDKPKIKEYDEIYTAEDKTQDKNLNVHRSYLDALKERRKNIGETVLENGFRQYNTISVKPNEKKSRVKRQDDDRCDEFRFKGKDQIQISHPHDKSKNVYYNNTDCVTTIAAEKDQIIQLTFVDVFHIEYHPDCAYDYLEVRDGEHGYAFPLGKFCGETFPKQIWSSGPYLWLKFHSDDTIEYEGFHINIKIEPSPKSQMIPRECYIELSGMYGVVDTGEIPEPCLRDSAQNLDVLWTITSPENTKIFLNFTTYSLTNPNECEENVVQVFGAVLEAQSSLANYCGSMANSVTTKGDTKEDNGNIMHVRFFATKKARSSVFKGNFTAFRSLDPNKDEKCTDNEFDCEDNTCIDLQLDCDSYANCRLKADEDFDRCNHTTHSLMEQKHILVILIIFSLILSGMTFVFLFKCIRKLYLDHKIIKEHIRQSCEDRLDALVTSSHLTLDPKQLERDSEPRASLERENHTNEMFKRQRNFSQHKPASIDSDYIQETQLDLEDEPWRREIESTPPDTEQVRIERNGRSRRSDLSRKEQSVRKDSRSVKERIDEDTRDRKEIKDVSVGAPDTKESGCQTRESLFDPASPDGTESGNSGSRGFSTFGYSGATIARPSPPAPATETSQITIELLRSMPSRQESQVKKLPDRRPMSSETTRSAPDVIIVSKPVR
ncbi:unnamed protein product [Plutella xylostella]|uniref:(diamondback moth) hypothetical protein n=1 Tax=Plutella xylostella TaxID=51655 RepID=A0A8S4FTY3_PLUXY|nr:unnamed protein product [Plutella xylostella]